MFLEAVAVGWSSISTRVPTGLVLGRVPTFSSLAGVLPRQSTFSYEPLAIPQTL